MKKQWARKQQIRQTAENLILELGEVTAFQVTNELRKKQFKGSAIEVSIWMYLIHLEEDWVYRIVKGERKYSLNPEVNGFLAQVRHLLG